MSEEMTEKQLAEIMELAEQKRIESQPIALEVMRELWARIPFNTEIELLDGRTVVLKPTEPPGFSSSLYEMQQEALKLGVEIPEEALVDAAEGTDHEPEVVAHLNAVLSDGSTLFFDIEHTGWESEEFPYEEFPTP